MKEASRLLLNMDLQCEVGIQESIEFTSTIDQPIPKLKDALKQAFESCEMELLHIEGGKIE